jgi:hypothetical protein
MDIHRNRTSSREELMNGYIIRSVNRSADRTRAIETGVGMFSTPVWAPSLEEALKHFLQDNGASLIPCSWCSRSELLGYVQNARRTLGALIDPRTPGYLLDTHAVCIVIYVAKAANAEPGTIHLGDATQTVPAPLPVGKIQWMAVATRDRAKAIEITRRAAGDIECLGAVFAPDMLAEVAMIDGARPAGVELA